MLFAVWYLKIKKRVYHAGPTLRVIYARGDLFSGRSYPSGDFSQAVQTALLPIHGSWHRGQQETQL